MEKWYVGVNGPLRKTFSYPITPTKGAFPEYKACIGPFYTKRAADICAAFGWNNPHLQTVTDCERIAKKGV